MGIFGNDQIMGPLRAVVPAVVAFAVGRGWLPGGMASDLDALIVAMLSAAWSYNSNTPSKP